jgi:hypothetical protein
MNLKSNFIKKSLKPIKKKLQNKDKLYVTIRRVYTHLSELSNEEILDYYNVNSLKELDTHIEHVKEVLKKQTEDYEEKLEELDACFCMDSRGDFKYLYESKKEAQQQVQFSLKTKRIKLTLYACPFHCGWHLSKV